MTRFGPMCRISALASLVLAGCGMNQEREFPLGPDEAAPTLEVARAPLSGAALASHDAHFQAPACLTPANSCDTGTLVNGRGPLGPEANAPNTLFSSCADGTAGEYHDAASLDQVRIYTEDGGGFLPNKKVTVKATVFATGNTNDRLVLYYAPDANAPQWTHVGTVQPTHYGSHVLSKTFYLSAGAEVQAIRAIMRTNSTSGSCASGSYADRDDLVFRLGDTPPQVILESPGVAVSGTVRFSANASDDIEINRVLFYSGADYLGYDSAAPYQLNWNSTAYSDGPHEFTATVVDGSNQRAVSAPVTVLVDNTSPLVFITEPSFGAVVSGTVTFKASAQDSIGVARVNFYYGSTLLGTFTQPPYEITWDTTDHADGDYYYLYAEAYDLAGHVDTTFVRFSIENDVEPTGSITSPDPQAVLSGTTPFSVRALDPQGIDRVTFYVGSKYVTWDGTAPYAINFNTLNFTNGDYVLTARIFDAAGNMIVTEGVPVRIQN
ncbi:Ig-like domain-containing protein [Hyalangium sp.]|uniref:Ig-like domain-containing protein n=1 Tax=Hyalangium sp. TaxID=2028555 RepID=UPI002D33DEF8|nr:Ig-like domain-containing protein [Hyalangium sp.]HYI00394.1 Ig-like domain-containing protein [Hyalangium sp.]